MAHSGKELIKILEANGWILERIRGSHHVYRNHDLKKSVPIPTHGNKDIGKGLFYKILKQCGIEDIKY